MIAAPLNWCAVLKEFIGTPWIWVKVASAILIRFPSHVKKKIAKNVNDADFPSRSPLIIDIICGRCSEAVSWFIVHSPNANWMCRFDRLPINLVWYSQKYFAPYWSINFATANQHATGCRPLIFYKLIQSIGKFFVPKRNYVGTQVSWCFGENQKNSKSNSINQKFIYQCE